jgi:hypothetical protein
VVDINPLAMTACVTTAFACLQNCIDGMHAGKRPFLCGSCWLKVTVKNPSSAWPNITNTSARIFRWHGITVSVYPLMPKTNTGVCVSIINSVKSNNVSIVLIWVSNQVFFHSYFYADCLFRPQALTQSDFTGGLS